MNILLTTLHAKYSHASLALPSLAASVQAVSGVSCSILELTINEPHGELLRRIVSQNADLIGFSCYIWNIDQTLRLVSDIKKIAPDTIIILGGPEVSFRIFELMHRNPAIDYVLKGEGEQVFKELLRYLVEGSGDLEQISNLFSHNGDEIIAGAESREYLGLDSLPSPFRKGFIDFSKPLIYYETSRGCPFSCAFCLSSTERQVRSYSMERIKDDLLCLMQRKTGTVKLVDRTFNYHAGRANEIWSYILQHNLESRFHFEIAADLLTDDNLDLLQQVPPHTFHFEIGIQSASPDTLEQVSRVSDLDRAYKAIRRLRRETNIELHLDLVAGLPGENYDRFLQSLQVLLDLEPHQIQVEPLKVLKGARMREIAARERYAYSDSPPYIILHNPWLSYLEVCRIETVATLVDLYYNQGKCAATLSWLAERMLLAQLFNAMGGNAEGTALHGMSTVRSFELLFRLVSPFLKEEELSLYADLLFYDYCRSEMPRAGKLPSFIAPRSNECSWPGGGRKEISGETVVPEGAKVTLFRFSFLRARRDAGANESPPETTFAYISTPGAGLKIVEL